jgi:hypothetical protein
MAQAVSRRSVNAVDLVRARVSPCGICDEQSGTDTGFSEFFGLPLSVSFHRRITLTYRLRDEKYDGLSSETSSVVVRGSYYL